MLNCRNVYAHEHVHEFGEVKHAVAAAYATHFAVCSNVVGLDAGMPYGEGHGLIHVRAYLHRSGMVGHQGYAYRLVPLGHLVKYRADHTAVEVFDGAELQLQVAVVSGFVACLDVYEEESDIFFEDYSGHIVEDDTLARLITMPNVLVTSHQAYLTTEALNNIAKTTIENILYFEKTGKCPNELHCLK